MHKSGSKLPPGPSDEAAAARNVSHECTRAAASGRKTHAGSRTRDFPRGAQVPPTKTCPHSKKKATFDGGLNIWNLLQKLVAIIPASPLPRDQVSDRRAVRG